MCLRAGHISKECHSKIRCSKCGKRHHNTICFGEKNETGKPAGMNEGATSVQQGVHNSSKGPNTSEENGSKLNANAPSFPPQQKTMSLYVSTNKTVLLQTALTTICNPNRPTVTRHVRAILDLGSQRSYISQRAAKSLHLQPEEVRKMAVFTFGSTEKTINNCEIVRATLKTLDGEIEMTLLTSPIICEPLTEQPLSLCVNSYEHLSDLHLADHSDGSPIEVDLLIGSDYYWQLTTGEVRRGKNDGPVAVGTKLGWVLSGPAPVADHSLLTSTHILRIDSREEENLNSTLRAFWELESLGISSTGPSVHQEFKENISFKDGRYEVCLPWKEQHPILTDNYSLSLKRLQSLLCRLHQTPDILQEYDSVIRKQIEQGIVQPVSDLGVVGEVHYLPHHAVVKRTRETTKVRVVYDASARSGGPSLNDCLYTGPSFNQKILDILLLFRSYPVAITSDIEKVFLMVSIAEEDRDALRFLWTEDLTNPDREIRSYRFTRVVFGVSSSPFLLNAKIDYHLKQYLATKPELVNTILNSIYVDDIVTGARNVEAAQRFYKDSRSVFREGGFNLRKFISNVPELQRFFDEDELSTSMSDSNSDCVEETYAKSLLGGNQTMNPKNQKVLGVRWNVSTECLIFSVQDIVDVAEKAVTTKRRVMSIIGKLYDPIGFLSPVVIKFKVFFKELCLTNLEWDEELSGELLHKLQLLIRSLQEAPTFSIPQFYLHDINFENASFSLHGYCDASREAYAAVIYLVTQNDSQLSVKFLTSKTRVAPQKEMSIPRLELLSAVLLSRLIESVTKSLQTNFALEQPTCYTDSKVSLYWITGLNKEWKQFVQNCVTEIRRLVPSPCWKHCPGSVNPADLPSRGITPIELSVSHLWHCGPDLVLLSQGSDFTTIEMPVSCLTEMKTQDKKVHALLSTYPTSCLENIITCKSYSSLSRLFSVTSHVIKLYKLSRELLRNKILMKTHLTVIKFNTSSKLR